MRGNGIRLRWGNKVPGILLERETGIEPATFSLGRLSSLKEIFDNDLRINDLECM
jgi:hypothetical protein